MSSKESITINSLRFQKYDSGEVHVHDDKKGIKFIMKTSRFKEEVKDITDALAKCDGAVKISGDNGISLFLLKQDKKLNCIVTEEKDVEKELATFVKGL